MRVKEKFSSIFMIEVDTYVGLMGACRTEANRTRRHLQLLKANNLKAQGRENHVGSILPLLCCKSQ